jgi:adhesin transport system membrane fusion protein
LSESLQLAQQELNMIKPLVEKKVVADIELIRARRTVADLDGQLKSTTEVKARIEAGLREAELQINEQTLIFRQTALSEMTDKRAELSVVQETIRGAAERLRRTDIRSPVDGVVNEIVVTTQGAFVNAGDRVVSIVPVEDTLLVEARIRPSDIAFIHPGQPSVVKVTAFDFSIFGGLEGTVETVSADTIVDPVTKDPYYTVIIRTNDTALKSARGINEIIPGMICNVDIMTGRKTVMQYLMKPINKAREQALRER